MSKKNYKCNSYKCTKQIFGIFVNSKFNFPIS